MPFDYLVSALVTLLVVVDPIGLVPTFLAVTHGLPKAARTQIAVRASIRTQTADNPPSRYPA